MVVVDEDGQDVELFCGGSEHHFSFVVFGLTCEVMRVISTVGELLCINC